jgi:hypothetical protein
MRRSPSERPMITKRAPMPRPGNCPLSRTDGDRAVKTWTRHDGTPGSPEGYRRDDGWLLRYERLYVPHGWVIAPETDHLPPLEARNHELGADEADKAQEWADGVIGFGQAWAGSVIDFGTEHGAPIM